MLGEGVWVRDIEVGVEEAADPEEDVGGGGGGRGGFEGGQVWWDGVEETLDWRSLRFGRHYELVWLFSMFADIETW